MNVATFFRRRTLVGDRWDQRRSVWSFVVLVGSPVLRNTPQMHRSQRRSDSIFGVTRLLTEAIEKPHPEYAWLIHRLAQIEVALVGIYHGILVCQIGDIEFSQPVGVDLISP